MISDTGYRLNFLDAFFWLRGGQEAIICVNMNIFGLGGGQEAIICANIEVTSRQEP